LQSRALVSRRWERYSSACAILVRPCQIRTMKVHFSPRCMSAQPRQGRRDSRISRPTSPRAVVEAACWVRRKVSPVGEGHSLCHWKRSISLCARLSPSSSAGVEFPWSAGGNTYAPPSQALVASGICGRAVGRIRGVIGPSILVDRHNRAVIPKQGSRPRRMVSSPLKREDDI